LVGIDPITREVELSWDWINPISAIPQDPTAFIIERKVGDEDWTLIAFDIAPETRSYTDTLSDSVAANVFVYGVNIGYRIKAYWIDTP
jgi:hypothetical protein